MSLPETPRGSFCPFQSYFTCLETQNVDKFTTFARFWSSWRGLGHRGILGDLYFQKWAPRLDGSTIFEILGNLYFQEWAPRLDGSTILETCTSKNGKRVTEGAYSFAWDKERAGEGVREDETRSQRKNNNALPDSFLYESLEAREQDGITAGEPESMSA